MARGISKVETLADFQLRARGNASRQTLRFVIFAQNVRRRRRRRDAGGGADHERFRARIVRAAGGGGGQGEGQREQEIAGLHRAAVGKRSVLRPARRSSNAAGPPAVSRSCTRGGHPATKGGTPAPSPECRPPAGNSRQSGSSEPVERKVERLWGRVNEWTSHRTVNSASGQVTEKTWRSARYCYLY
ncbi:Hypothetical protein NTJ_04028 [Nesidiocoris tenuis]|uniref:Uncharacterized protein n=1 Tax=Nesidiocoris tenuis TaxID=355587 RepID=A0ABN7AG11_9HEMI|nr:Hypothetical protein NTJ_04028 [Nesidiocoris tenuis]